MSELTPETMKKFTQYVCPVDGGLGHSSRWTGAMKGQIRDNDHLCSCGATYVEEVQDGLHVLTWEMITPGETDWHPVEKEHRVKRNAEEQQYGLLQLIQEGEDIRAVQLKSYAVTEEDTAPSGNALSTDSEIEIDVCINADPYDPCTRVRIAVGDNPRITARQLWNSEAHQWEMVPVGEESPNHYVTAWSSRRPVAQHIRDASLGRNHPPPDIDDLIVEKG